MVPRSSRRTLYRTPIMPKSTSLLGRPMKKCTFWLRCKMILCITIYETSSTTKILDEADAKPRPSFMYLHSFIYLYACMVDLLLVQFIFVQSLPNLIGLDEIDWTKRGWTKRCWNTLKQLLNIKFQ